MTSLAQDPESAAVERTVGAQVPACNKDSFPGSGPAHRADFRDVETFPGPRCLNGQSMHNHRRLITALLADGVSRDALFPLDIDRAINKLRERRPHISACWTSGSRSQDLMRSGECVMSNMWSGRALSLRNEGVQIGVVRENAIIDIGARGIAMGARNVDSACRFLDFFMIRPEAHKAFSREIPYVTPNKDVLSLLSEEEKKDFSTCPENCDTLAHADYQWVADNYDGVRARYAEFLNE